MAQPPKKKIGHLLKDVTYVDYKNVRLIRRFIDRFGRIKKRYYTGTSLKQQKAISRAIKNARRMALIPFIK